MKIETPDRPLVRSGTTSEHAFSIKTTSKAFDILSSGLYSDPILAIVRELSCNAHDSHVAAKNPEPFEIHLPNNVEPFFSVTDYGLGLSEEDIYGLYTTYFESTKSDSNDFIGALGLGSKSPFSYSNAFEVISTFGGVKSIYSIFLNEQRIPTVSKMMEIATPDAKNGVAVKITVKKEDFRTFKDRTASVLRYLDPAPRVVGWPGFEFDKIPEGIVGNKWIAANYQHGNYLRHGMGNFVAIQGNVPYRVDTDKVRDKLSTQEQHFVRSTSISFFFDIGQLDVTANREEIRYDDYSSARLVAAIQQVHAEWWKIVDGELAHTASMSRWDAFRAISAYVIEKMGSLSIFYDLANKQHTENLRLHNYLVCAGVMNVIRSDNALEHFEIREYSKPKYNAVSMSKPHKTQVHVNCMPHLKEAVLFLDVKTGGIRRIFNWQTEAGHDRGVFLICPIHKLSPTDKDVVAEYNRIVEAFGDPTVINVSTLDKPPAAVREKKAVMGIAFYKLKDTACRPYYSSKFVPSWTSFVPTDSAAPTTGLYYVIARNTTAVVGKTADSQKLETGRSLYRKMSNIITIINEKKGTNYTMDNVWGVKSKHARKIVADSNWTNLFDLAKECLDVAVPAYIHARRTYLTKRYYGDVCGFLENRPDFLDRLSDNSPFKKTCKSMLQPEATAITDAVVEMARELGGMLTRCIDDDPLNYRHFEHLEPYFTADSFTEYPMLSLVNDFGYDDNTVETLVHYIQQIDEMRKSNK